MKKQTTDQKRRRFERIVVLVDITVVLLQPEPKKLYATHIFNSVSRILQQCNEHSKFSTIWGYKFFDPFHSHLAAKSKLGEFMGEQPSAQFDAFAPNLEKFRKVLKNIVNNHRQYDSGGSRWERIAQSIKDVIGNYTWDPLLASDSSSSDEESKALKERQGGGDYGRRDPNAIILFSSVPTTWADVSWFFDAPQLVAGDQQIDLSAQGLLTGKFRPVRDALKERNIQVCFVDVPNHQDLWSDDRLDTLLKPSPARNLVLKSLHRSFKAVIPSELLVVSPTLVPGNLVWNTMADLGIHESKKGSYARVLCKEALILCDVLLQPFGVTHTPLSSKGPSALKLRRLPTSSTIGNMDIILSSVLPKSSVTMKLASERFYVRLSTRTSAPLIGEDSDQFGDKLLQLLAPSAFLPGQPGWQLLLLTLASEDSVCEVSLRNPDDGLSLKAVLEPFTAHIAILRVFGNESLPVNADTLSSGGVSRLSGVNTDMNVTSRPEEAMNFIQSSKDSADCCKQEGGTVFPSRKGPKVAANKPDKVYWEPKKNISASAKLTSDCSTVMSKYINHGNASQLLQLMDSFLKETRQSKFNLDSGGSQAVTVERVQPSPQQAFAPTVLPDSADTEELSYRAYFEELASGDIQLEQIREPFVLMDTKLQDDSSFAVEDVQAGGQEIDPYSAAWQTTAEEAREYISSIGQRVEDYLSSADVDSVRFAGILVAEAIRSMYVLVRKTDDDEQQISAGAEENSKKDSNRKLAAKLKKLLLISPKRLLAKYKESGTGTTGCAIVDEKVKEHELQILLRLEMVAFDEGQWLEQTAQDQLVEDVCKLLDSIQFHLDGGIFGGKSLSKYCDRLLVSRYKERIPSTISKIYSVMELDGYSVLTPPNLGPEILNKVSPPGTGDLLLLEAGATQDSISSLPQKMSSSGSGGLPSGNGDTASQPSGERASKAKKDGDDSSLQTDSLGKGQKKGSYHFASHASSLLRRRKFKSRRPHMSTHSKRSKRHKRTVLGTNDPGQIVCHLPAPPVELIPTSCVPETCKTSVLTSMDQDAVGSPDSFSALLKSTFTVPLEMEAGPHLLSHLFLSGDEGEDDDDDDDEGIVSTPFKASYQSAQSLQSSQSDPPEFYKRLDLSTCENARDGITFPPSVSLFSFRPFFPVAGLPDATAVGDTSMSRKEDSSEFAQLREHDSTSRSIPETGCIVHERAASKDSCAEGVTLGKALKEVLHSSALMPRNPLGSISVNSAQNSSIQQYSSVELLSVSARDTPGINYESNFSSGVIHDKENQPTVRRKRSINSSAGLATAEVCSRKTRARTLLEQNMPSQPTANTRRRKGRVS